MSRLAVATIVLAIGSCALIPFNLRAGQPEERTALLTQRRIDMTRIGSRAKIALPKSSEHDRRIVVSIVAVETANRTPLRRATEFFLVRSASALGCLTPRARRVTLGSAQKEIDAALRFFPPPDTIRDGRSRDQYALSILADADSSLVLVSRIVHHIASSYEIDLGSDVGIARVAAIYNGGSSPSSRALQYGTIVALVANSFDTLPQ